jgi:uncharacterized RDD family membrane protein YckC
VRRDREDPLMRARVPATLTRRLGAAFYDLLVVIAIWIVVYFPLIALGRFDGSIGDSLHPLHLALRLGLAFAYFGWCWTRGGATLGALAWKLEVARVDGAAVTWSDAARRFGVALGYLAPLALLEAIAPGTQSHALFYLALLGPFLAGALASLSDPERRAFHERFLVTRLGLRADAKVPA